MTTYWIIAQHLNGTERNPLSTLFATPFQASTFLSKLGSSSYQRSVRVATWREREARMFEPDPQTQVSVYSRPIWNDEQWWENVRHHFKDHFVHVSFLDPQAIAFTESEEKGEQDRQTMMRPGKYLQKFLCEGPSGEIEHGPLKGWNAQITKMQVAYYAAWHHTGKRPQSDDILGFTEDEDEMVRLYDDGPPSCMAAKSDWSHEDHPVRVYAGGGLALAYLNSVAGDVVARALCWPVKEVFGRVYPTVHSGTDQHYYDELMARLKAKGWQSIDENNKVFEGALLQQRTNGWGKYIMPYLDHDYGVREHYQDGRTWWRMTRNADHQDNITGVMTGSDPDWTCESCEEGFTDDEDSYTVYNRWQGGRNGYPRGDAQWCDSCRCNNAFFCDGSDEYFDDGYADRIEAADGCTYHRGWFEANGGWQCAYSDEYYRDCDDEPVRLTCGMLIHADNLEEAAFQCFVTQLWWSRDVESEAVPGYHEVFDFADPHPVEMEYVVPCLPEDYEDQVAWAQGLTAHVVPEPQRDLFILDPVVVIDISKSAIPVITPISVDELYSQLTA